ncbi:MAG: NAD-dependent dihydropyrimidine dehydrogenase subunit PreA [Erysipelotrichaceae bacterium]|nr:NAD-dependent dihydropyrimidine dehydrogenase subunit PreA [Erysipelotrichaceae bacterium]
MKSEECLLCHQAACTRACGKLDPAAILRSLYFDNEAGALRKLNEPLACAECDGRCQSGCPVEVPVRNIILSLKDKSVEPVPDYDCLRTDFCGFPLINPFLLSSSVVASTYEMCARAFEAGWAGAAFKTVCLMDIKEASPRFSAIRGDNGRIIGFKNIEQLSDHTLEENLAIFRRLKKDYPDRLLLVSFMGRDDEEWAFLAEKLSEAGADALEMNFSCPNMTEENTGSDVGQIPQLVERYTRTVREHTSLPIIAKLTPNVTDIRESAEAAVRGGCDGLAAINTIKSLIEVDIDPTDGIYRASIGGYSGKAVKPIALRFTAELSQDEKLAGQHITAMGGIESWKDALEFIVLGADSVQVTTAIMQYGYRIIDDLREGLALYLEDHGFQSVRDIENSAIEGIVPTEQLDRSYIIYPRFLRERCVGCQRCYLSCLDGGHQAISIKEGKPVLDSRKCVGCHLCVLVCPNEAIVSSEVRVPKKEV